METTKPRTPQPGDIENTIKYFTWLLRAGKKDPFIACECGWFGVPAMNLVVKWPSPYTALTIGEMMIRCRTQSGFTCSGKTVKWEGDWSLLWGSSYEEFLLQPFVTDGEIQVRNIDDYGFAGWESDHHKQYKAWRNLAYQKHRVIREAIDINVFGHKKKNKHPRYRIGV